MKIAEIATNLSIFNRPFYHGTARRNLNFRPHNVAYFTDSYEDAVDHAVNDVYEEGEVPHVIVARLEVRSPVEIEEFLMQDLHFKQDEHQRLLQMGYDTAIGPWGAREVCVLDPRVIRVQKVIPVGLNESKTVAYHGSGSS